MPEYPLLIFPEPTSAQKTTRNGFGRPPLLPDGRRQAERLTPLFARLQQAMERQALALRGNSLGLQPEQALVLETIGTVDRFINAINRVPGLEWLGEFEADEIAPEYGFEDEEDPQKQLKGQVFLIMTDQRALHEIQSLFNSWKQNRESNFPRGLAPLKHAFAHLHTIRPWGAEDRIRDTGLLEDWKYRIEQGQEVVPFEVELWFRENAGRRRKAEEYLGALLESLGGEVRHPCVIPEIAYHGLLGKIPIAAFSELLAEITRFQDFRLLQCEDIMHIRPVGQCAIRAYEDLAELVVSDGRQTGLPEGEPVVALFDGLPLTGHRLLNGRLIVDDPDGYESPSYLARDRVHGTAMASLICHGDLDDGGAPIRRPLYVRPIMQPQRGFGGTPFEAIPEAVLPIDLVHRAVRRLYEVEGSQQPVAPSIRVINLSVCDCARPFDRGMSSWARLLDWLSWEYNVLFLVSAGNRPHDIELNVRREDFRTLTVEEREKAVIKAIAEDTRHRRLLSPAETVNGLTVSAIHADGSTVTPSPILINPFVGTGFPCTFSPHGPGYRRTIKPDIFLPGGRQFLLEKLGTAHLKATLQASPFHSPPGQSVAAPGPAGELDRTWHTRGTSNAAALASRWANSLFDMIDQLRPESGGRLSVNYDAVLLKTLLVHGADWETAGPLYEEILRNTENSRTFRDYVSKFIGYGLANVAKVMSCTDQCVTILGVGALRDGEAQEFSLPLPPSLSALAEKRRLTITLAWLTPVNSMRQAYRIAHLWFDTKNRIATDNACADRRAVQRGTVQHEVLEGEHAVDFQDGDNIVIKVNCRADAGEILHPIRYGLAVSLEVAESVGIPIYQEIRDRLQIRVPVRGAGLT